MKTAQINKYGGNEVIEINSKVSKPQVEEGKIVVEVHMASINPVDWKIRQGYLAEMMPLQFPAIMGGDFSGVVTEVGGGVSELSVGDEVYGQAGVILGGSGSFAEYALASAQNVAKKPKNISHEEAASLPLAGVSATQALLENIDLKKGQKILIHGGAGGIGSFAIQIAKYLGAYVYTTASTKDAEYVKELSADNVIDYKSQKFEDIAKDCDAVFDLIGGETYTRSFDVLKKGGVIVSMAEQPNKELMEKYGVQAVNQFTQPTRERLEKLTGLLEQGAVKVHIDKIFSLDEASEALSYMETGHPKGKIVLRVK
jgi:NADPH:quinone reductase-like Zn-dependent oxidoreductase